MDEIHALPDWVAGYHPTLIALTIACLLVLSQTVFGVLFGMILGHEEPGGKYQGSYKDFGYRALRTHLNSTETFAVFALSAVLAMTAGATPQWVNGFAVFYVVTRLIYWFFYYGGVGANNGGPRTMAFVIGWATNVGLALLALIALLN